MTDFLHLLQGWPFVVTCTHINQEKKNSLGVPTYFIVIWTCCAISCTFYWIWI